MYCMCNINVCIKFRVMCVCNDIDIQVQHWLLQFSKELAERLSEDTKAVSIYSTHTYVHMHVLCKY